jgi:limonene-1,2-epoxide hydrolase
MRNWILALVLTFAGATGAYAKEAQKQPDAKIAVVEKMIDAWNKQDWARVGALFTEDGVLHSMMSEPVVGRKAVSDRLTALGAGIQSITLHVSHIGRIGDAVFVERVDEFVYKGHPGKVPVVGVLFIEGGKVKEWREYYDRAQLLSEMGVK